MRYQSMALLFSAVHVYICVLSVDLNGWLHSKKALVVSDADQQETKPPSETNVWLLGNLVFLPLQLLAG